MDSETGIKCTGCGRDFGQAGALATHRRSCQGSKRKVEDALKGGIAHLWKKTKKQRVNNLDLDVLSPGTGTSAQAAAPPSISHNIAIEGVGLDGGNVRTRL